MILYCNFATTITHENSSKFDTPVQYPAAFRTAPPRANLFPSGHSLPIEYDSPVARCRGEGSEITMPKEMPRVTHVIFDMDGLLLDTESFYTLVQTVILKRYNREFTYELKSKMMGLKALEAAQVMINELGLHGEMTAESFVEEREFQLDLLFPESQLLPGAERLVRHLVKHNVPIALATSSHRRHFDLKTQKHRELFALFHPLMTGDEVARGKPSPDIFLTAAQQFDPPAAPEHCLVFEDALPGVAAAKAANMHAVAVPDQRMDISQYGAADSILQSLEDFKPEDWHLPPFE